MISTGIPSSRMGQIVSSRSRPIGNIGGGLNFARNRFAFGQEQQLAQLQFRQQKTAAERGAYEFGELQAGAGLRGLERQLGMAKASIGLAEIGDVREAGQRAYTFGRESEEFNRLKMAAEARRLQGQMAFQPQMEAIRGGIMGRMAGRLGVNLPTMAQTYQSGTGYTPSWMQNYQPPQFPRYS